MEENKNVSSSFDVEKKRSWLVKIRKKKPKTKRLGNNILYKNEQWLYNKLARHARLFHKRLDLFHDDDDYKRNKKEDVIYVMPLPDGFLL